ncbi:DnaA N-terminal domain-containing protein [Paenibacillus sp. MMO-177]|uniref:DnaA N-terminal domain-containing protein n=1 Tax=Paenibacillus sp. MMO-177 TaxID=3081289 RepID=UPI00301B038A
MEKKKNLKGGTSELIYYRSRPTGNKIARSKKVGDKDVPYYEDEVEQIIFKEDDVQKFSLDKHGQNIPYVDGHLTIINNYMFDYWSHFLSAEGIALFGHLKRYCYGEKDYCWPNLELISLKMNKSRNTVKKFLAILETYGFVYQFQVKNKSNYNNNESALFKVRKKVPFLSKALYEQLPPILQADHDRYLQQLVDTCERDDLELDFDVDYNELYSDLIEKGDVQAIKNKPKQMSLFEIEKQQLIHKQLVLKEQTEEDIQVWATCLRSLEEKLSKPTYDTWFKNTFAIKRGTIYTIYTPSDFVTNWLKDRYLSVIGDVLRNIDPTMTNIIIETLQT